MKTSRCAGLLAFAAVLVVPSAMPQGQPGMFFEGDMVLGGSPAAKGFAVCALTSQFKLGQQVVWRIRVRDGAGRNLDGAALKGVVVELPDGQKFAARFGPHPAKGEPGDHFWSVSWNIPADYPTGTIAYKVTATGAMGASTTWEPFRIRASQLTIVK